MPGHGSAATARNLLSLRLDDLLARLAAGETTAFTEFYTQTAPQAYGLSLRMLGDQGLAESAVADAYLTIWRTAASFDQSQDSSLGWIFTIVHRTATDQARSGESRSARSRLDPTPDQANASQAPAVRAALAGLSLPHREALELAYFDGYTYREVAELLGVPDDTAKTGIQHGLVGLRQSMITQPARGARREELRRQNGG